MLCMVLPSRLCTQDKHIPAKRVCHLAFPLNISISLCSSPMPGMCHLPSELGTCGHAWPHCLAHCGMATQCNVAKKGISIEMQCMTITQGTCCFYKPLSDQVLDSKHLHARQALLLKARRIATLPAGICFCTSTTCTGIWGGLAWRGSPERTAQRHPATDITCELWCSQVGKTFEPIGMHDNSLPWLDELPFGLLERKAPHTRGHYEHAALCRLLQEISRREAIPRQSC